jgi:hypothetical protein
LWSFLVGSGFGAKWFCVPRRLGGPWVPVPFNKPGRFRTKERPGQAKSLASAKIDFPSIGKEKILALGARQARAPRADLQTLRRFLLVVSQVRLLLRLLLSLLLLSLPLLLPLRLLLFFPSFFCGKFFFNLFFFVFFFLLFFPFFFVFLSFCLLVFLFFFFLLFLLVFFLSCLFFFLFFFFFFLVFLFFFFLSPSYSAAEGQCGAIVISAPYTFQSPT